ncbi:restriction endonuclease subunit S [Acinetobacter boissieri]|uniref:Type I restriction modification DNA specificity domain-containing protein n=1 Tax=Acinetobacter boissieri TaxID=1219383 RepID=A0A1G6GJW2_9GAMM|nr:restriction endonuclease subunit S [Acinetobacter boissieri]SDB82209.1 Type I restriction modification DNA specificity domain-containing protein [Acinetobacter boissieri]
MQQQLEQLEKDAGIEWQEFEIGELFDVGTGSLIDNQQAKKGEIPRISVQVTNNGIIGYLNEHIENAKYLKNFLSVNFFGISFYHPYRASVEMKVHTLKLKDRELTHATGLFLSTTLNKKFKDVYSYGNQLSSSKLKNNGIKIQLPTINNQISYEFMEKFIATLNAERFATLNAYLCTTGLKDYQLTQTEQKALDELEDIKWGEFNLQQLYGRSQRGRRLKSADRICGNLPFVTAGEANMGISALVSNDVQVFNSNTITIDMFGSAKYRNYEYGADDHVAVVHTQNLPKFAVIFITTAIHKSSNAGQFDYSRNFYASDADELSILLPIKADHTPDYPYIYGNTHQGHAKSSH